MENYKMIMNDLIEQMGGVIDWAEPHFKELCTEVLKYYIIMGWLVVFITIIVLIVNIKFGVCLKKGIQRFKETGENNTWIIGSHMWSCGYDISSLSMGIIVSLVGVDTATVWVFVENVINLIQIYTTPTLFITEYLMNFVN